MNQCIGALVGEGHSLKLVSLVPIRSPQGLIE